MEKIKDILKANEEKNKIIKEFIEYFYRYMDVGIKNIKYNILSQDFIENTKIKVKEILENKELNEKELLEIFLEKDNRIYLVYEIKDGELEIPIEEESEGIKQILYLGVSLAEALYYNKIVVFDKLEVGFHPLLARKIVELFLSEKNRAQLLFTAHNTTLLDLNLFRRDQIYFTNRSPKQVLKQLYNH